VYEKLFHWLVARINKSLAPNGKQSNFIGILDIFGFEIFKQNSFEQLCINFCNEKLQQLFNEDTFKNEEAVYRSEGVSFPPIVFIDNQPVVDLIESRGGIFTILDDIVKGPGKPETKDATFGTTMDAAFKANPVFVASNQHKGIAYTAFSINHYAGTVTYDVDMFVDKNKDSLFSDLYDMMAQSSDPLIKLQFSAAQGARRTLASEFKSQLTDLMRSLRVTESHYIRCVKSNSQKKPRVFEGFSCLEQLRCAGVFEAVTIRKNGYPFRYTFQRFVERYKCIMATESGWVPLKSRDKRQQCHEIITTTKQPFSNLKWGSSMLFFRADEYCILHAPSRKRVCFNEILQVPCSRVMPCPLH
jgi:myosin heavy subunit